MISKLDESVFANVDLDIYSKQDLRPLIGAFGDRVIEMWVGRVRRTYEAHLELGWTKVQNPTSIILGFCRLVESLKPSQRKLWNVAKRKSFDIGIHAPARNHHYWSAVESRGRTRSRRCRCADRHYGAWADETGEDTKEAA